MDPELLKKIQARRGVVDSEGTDWETAPGESSADVRAAEDFSQAETNSELVWETSPQQSLADARAQQAEDSRSIEAAAGSCAAVQGRGASSAGGSSTGGYAGNDKKGASKEDFLKRLQARRELADSNLWETNPEESSADARAPQEWNVVEDRGVTAPGSASSSSAVRREPKNSAGDTASKVSATPMAKEEEASSADELRAKRKQQIEMERAAWAADCAGRWPALLKVGEETDAKQLPEKDITEEDLHMIKADVQRTRTVDSAFQDATMHTRMENMLTRFCSQEQVRYRQGLHEVAAIFAFVESVAPAGCWHGSMAFLCFSAFVHRFIPYFHDGESFVTLHASLLFFRQLVLYHCPDLHSQMEKASVSPISYATPWFLTLFAARTPLSVVLRLWDRYLTDAVPSFLPFLGVAMVNAERSVVLDTESAEIQKTRVSLGLRTPEKLDAVWAEAERLRLQTPRSFVLRQSRVMEAIVEKRANAQPEAAWSERVLSQIEKERYFSLLPGEVAAFCAQAAKNANDSSKLRFLILDVRAPSDQHTEQLSQALRFYPPCLHRLVMAGGGWAHFERLATALSAAVTGFLANAPSGADGESSDASPAGGSGDASSLNTPASTHGADQAALFNEVFDALHAAASATWGPNWSSEDGTAHLVLLGDSPVSDQGAIAPLYDLLTEHKALARVSVALGGATAVHREATKRGIELVESKLRPDASSAGSGGESFLGSAWSRLQAASDSLPPASGMGERLEGWFQGIAEGAAVVRQQAAEHAAVVRQQAAVVRQQAAESAAVVRQQAAEGMTSFKQKLDNLDQDFLASDTKQNDAASGVAVDISSQQGGQNPQ
eukprot:TRINITY_DN24795_c0_g1_i1.p1 TRINITY_DN24795_c0_g1~~TRINITY_DN24795_c0_g1_i1.p1  ORF type:complete len:837 (+),score=187.27 TRINITY_DN24795_c0_g1_i1:29-2539(+)